MENRIGFFGGCFNPVTNAHINLIKEVIKKEKLDKVYFVPMGDFYEKKDLLPLEMRVKMLKLAFSEDAHLKVLEISNTMKKTYAIDTFKKIEEMFPNVERFFIMGSDNFKKMKNWKDAEQLKKYQYIVLDRENREEKNISSTLVRDKLKHGEDIYSLAPVPVIHYMNQNNLYK